MSALAIYDNGRFAVMQQAAGALATSGFFRDATQQAQALVKVMAGAELGLPPFASMTGIHIIKGKPALGANVIATLIKNDPRYDYRVAAMTDLLVEIDFYENGTKSGTSAFSADDAQKAGTQNMHKFPRNMLFARAISNGARWYAPGIFGGSSVYTPDELGATVDEDGNIIDITPARPAQAKATPPPQAIAQPAEAEMTASEATASELLDVFYDTRGRQVATIGDICELISQQHAAYKDKAHVLNALNLHPQAVELDFQFDYETKASNGKRVKLMAWLIERKAQPAEAPQTVEALPFDDIETAAGDDAYSG